MYFSIFVPQRLRWAGGLERPSLLRTVTPFGVPVFRPTYWLCQTLELRLLCSPSGGRGALCGPLPPAPTPRAGSGQTTLFCHGKYKRDGENTVSELPQFKASPLRGGGGSAQASRRKGGNTTRQRLIHNSRASRLTYSRMRSKVSSLTTCSMRQASASAASISSCKVCIRNCVMTQWRS